MGSDCHFGGPTMTNRGEGPTSATRLGDNIYRDFIIWWVKMCIDGEIQVLEIASDLTLHVEG